MTVLAWCAGLAAAASIASGVGPGAGLDLEAPPGLGPLTAFLRAVVGLAAVHLLVATAAVAVRAPTVPGLPRRVGRLVVVAAGTSLVLAPAAGADAVTPTTAVTTETPAPEQATLRWVGADAAPPDSTPTEEASTTITTKSTTTTTTTTIAGEPSHPTPRSDHRAPAPDASASPDADGWPEWEVRAGQHLWGITASQLAEAFDRLPTDAEIARHLHEVIRANRSRLVRPDDPDLILPGQRLVLPPPR